MKKWYRFLIYFFLISYISSCASTYLGRYIVWNKADIYDYQNFPVRTVETGHETFTFRYSDEEKRKFAQKVETIQYRTGEDTARVSLEELLISTETTAFLVIQDDTVLYENYFNGFSRDSICTSFSIAKSITSALIGIAIDEGLIASVDDPVSMYLEELNQPDLPEITIRQLLSMSSGLKHVFSYAPFSDATKSYYSPDIRKNALRIKSIDDPGQYFLYNNCHTQLLGMILERTSGLSVADYTAEKLWQPIESEWDALWNMDSEKSGFELMAMGFNARALDYAKLGRLYLNEGNWNGNQVISRDWIIESTRSDSNINNSEDFYFHYTDADDPVGEFFRDLSGYYSYSWWGYRNGENLHEFFAYGILNQYIYLCPEKNLMILRFGEGGGDVYWWPEVLKGIAEII